MSLLRMLIRLINPLEVVGEIVRVDERARGRRKTRSLDSAERSGLLKAEMRFLQGI